MTYCAWESLNKGTAETVILVFCRNSKVFYTNVVVGESSNLILGIVFPKRNLLPVIAKVALY